MRSTSPNKKKGGSKLNRTELVQVRIDPRLRFLAEIASKAQIRTLSSFIEYSIQRQLHEVSITHLISNTDFFDPNKAGDISVTEFGKKIWDNDEVVRFIRLAQNAPLFLSTDEQDIWDVICNQPCFWIHNIFLDERVPNIKLIKLMWGELGSAGIEGLDMKVLEEKMVLLAEGASEEQLKALKDAINNAYGLEDAIDHAFIDDILSADLD